MPEDMISLRLGEELRERLERVISAMQEQFPIKDVQVSRSVVIRQALATGLGKLEADLGLKGRPRVKKRTPKRK